MSCQGAGWGARPAVAGRAPRLRRRVGGERVVGDARSCWYAQVGYRRTGSSAGAGRVS